MQHNPDGVLQYRQDYVGGIEYRYTTAGGLTLEAVNHSEGRVYNNGGTLRYEYAIRDHLTGVRNHWKTLKINNLP